MAEGVSKCEIPRSVGPESQVENRHEKWLFMRRLQIWLAVGSDQSVAKSFLHKDIQPSDFGFSRNPEVAAALQQRNHHDPGRGGIVSTRTTVTLCALLALALMPVCVHAQASEEIPRRAKTKVQPFYPELARKMNITGTVKVEVVVAPSGVVKEARVIGGHPVLANAALDAVRKWRFEPAAMESTGIVDFKFDSRQ